MSHTILIVENETVLTRNVRALFERSGHVVHWVESAGAAERQIESCHPNLLILSHQPPQLDGIGLLRRLGRSDPGLPVIIVSAEATVELAVEAIKLGAAEFLTKPVSLARLRHAAEALLNAAVPNLPVGYFRMREDARMRANGRR